MWRSRCVLRPCQVSLCCVETTQILRDVSRVPELGTIFGVWAHPDDEAYLAGGIMALSRRAGNRVVCVTATRGELGTPDPATWPPDRLAAERTIELERSLEILGVIEHEWLDLPDGGCAELADDTVVPRLSELMRQIQPRTVLTFGPDGMTGHSDHAAVSRWTTLAFDEAAPPEATLHYATLVPDWYEEWQPIAEKLNIVMDESVIASTPRDQLSMDLSYPEDIVALKLDALRAQKTQTTILIDAVGEDAFRAWVGDERYRRARPR